MKSTASVVDAPKISCFSSEALIDDKNVRLRCEIRAKPRLSALFWIIDGNGTALAEGEVVNGHWTLVVVCIRSSITARFLFRVVQDVETIYVSLQNFAWLNTLYPIQ